MLGLMSQGFVFLSLIDGQQENNEVIRTWGLPRQEINLWNHVDLAHHLGIVDLEAGTFLLQLQQDFVLL